MYKLSFSFNLDPDTKNVLWNALKGGGAGALGLGGVGLVQELSNRQKDEDIMKNPEAMRRIRNKALLGTLLGGTAGAGWGALSGAVSGPPLTPAQAAEKTRTELIDKWYKDNYGKSLTKKVIDTNIAPAAGAVVGGTAGWKMGGPTRGDENLKETINNAYKSMMQGKEPSGTPMDITGAVGGSSIARQHAINKLIEASRRSQELFGTDPRGAAAQLVHHGLVNMPAGLGGFKPGVYALKEGVNAAAAEDLLRKIHNWQEASRTGMALPPEVLAALDKSIGQAVNPDIAGLAKRLGLTSTGRAIENPLLKAIHAGKETSLASGNLRRFGKTGLGGLIGGAVPWLIQKQINPWTSEGMTPEQKQAFLEAAQAAARNQ